MRASESKRLCWLWITPLSIFTTCEVVPGHSATHLGILCAFWHHSTTGLPLHLRRGTVMQLTAVGHCSASNARAAEACWQCPLFTPSVVQLYQRPDDQNGVYIRTSDFAFQRHKLFQPGKPSVWKLEASQRYFFAHVSIFRQACTARAEKEPLLYLALAPGFSDRPLFQEMMMGWGKGTMVLGCWGCWVYFCTCRSVYV